MAQERAVPTVCGHHIVLLFLDNTLSNLHLQIFLGEF